MPKRWTSRRTRHAKQYRPRTKKPRTMAAPTRFGVQPTDRASGLFRSVAMRIRISARRGGAAAIVPLQRNHDDPGIAGGKRPRVGLDRSRPHTCRARTGGSLQDRSGTGATSAVLCTCSTAALNRSWPLMRALAQCARSQERSRPRRRPPPSGGRLAAPEVVDRPFPRTMPFRASDGCARRH